MFVEGSFAVNKQNISGGANKRRDAILSSGIRACLSGYEPGGFKDRSQYGWSGAAMVEREPQRLNGSHYR